MSRARRAVVQFEVDAATLTLLAEIESAHRRATKCEPGERTDIASYEALATSLEQRAARALATSSGTACEWEDDMELTAGLFYTVDADVFVSVNFALEPGPTVLSELSARAPEPAEVVEIRDDVFGRALVLARFREQLDKAIAEPGRDRGSAMSPSGIHNRVLTEVLREYVQWVGEPVGPVPVEYRDGSRASAEFPLRCLDLRDDLDTDDSVRASGGTVLRLALLSIRHTEMDAVVDGAWLRNAAVSKARTAAQTDDYVFHESVRQLKEATGNGQRKLRLYLFQTGLDTAVVGFFRAAVEFLLDHPGQLEVIPMFFTNRPRDGESGDPFAGYERGAAWAAAGGSR
jgi:hypothetical protein